MKIKASIMDDVQMRRAIIRMSHEIIEQNRGAENLYLIGIQRRGVPLAQRMAEIIETVENKTVKVGVLDITLYRDDLSLIAEHPQIKSTDIPFSVENSNIVLVDDVLFTGRTVRAALNAVMEMGRPRSVQLAALIDRGNREMPIGANYLGKAVPTSRDELVSVSLIETDGTDSVEIYSMKD